MRNVSVHALINLKQEIVEAIEKAEVSRGRTNISRLTRMNWNYYANTIIHVKNISYHGI
jgi:hypothetical protein